MEVPKNSLDFGLCLFLAKPLALHAVTICKSKVILPCVCACEHYKCCFHPLTMIDAGFDLIRHVLHYNEINVHSKLAIRVETQCKEGQEQLGESLGHFRGGKAKITHL